MEKVKIFKIERKTPKCEGCYFYRQATNRERSSCEKRRLRSEMEDLREMFDFDGDYRCTLDFQQFIFVDNEGLKKHLQFLENERLRKERSQKIEKERRIAAGAKPRKRKTTNK